MAHTKAELLDLVRQLETRVAQAQLAINELANERDAKVALAQKLIFETTEERDAALRKQRELEGALAMARADAEYGKLTAITVNQNFDAQRQAMEAAQRDARDWRIVATALAGAVISRASGHEAG